MAESLAVKGLDRNFASFEEYVASFPKYDLGQAPLEVVERLRMDPNDVYTDVSVYPGIYLNHEYQHAMVRLIGGKCLNAACADDPAKLGELGAINLDFLTHTPASNRDQTKIPNFVHGTVMDMPFPDEHFDCVVLGEFLEHCKPEKAVQAITECRRVLKAGKYLVLTVPLDARPRDEQRGSEDWPLEYDAGITCHHQTWWCNDMILDLKRKVRMIEVGRAALFYMLTAPLGGWGLCWQKP